MPLLLLPVLEVIFALGGTRAQSVTQPDVSLSVLEETTLELRCNFSTGFSLTLMWYVQYPNQGLQLLLKYVSGSTVVKGIQGFEAEFMTSESSFHLRKPAAQLNDSAQYFCAVND
uniref:Ig-like domain-containing protein n=1 Tax=Otolemur garnettii TaxID=30611 RepID=H0XIY4_OTOGA